MKLELDNVELNYGDKSILKSVYFSAQKNEIVGVFGRNGSGKTSLLEIIFGSVSPKYKLIRINKKPIQKKLYKTGWVSYLPQYHFIPTHLRLKTIFSVYHISWKKFIQNFEDFAIYENEKAAVLSGGELRIVETYLVLFSKAKILLLDEPFSNIAPLQIEKIRELIKEQKSQKIVVISDHFYHDVLAISDRLYMVNEKRVFEIENQKELKNHGYLL